VKSIKRFYKDAAAQDGGQGFSILLDGRAVKTPGARLLCVPSSRLAEAIAEEWRSQGEQVLPSTMPMTQLASTALDRVGPERPHITQQLMNYAGTDLLCYRAEIPADLVARQTATWQPLLDWAAQALDAPLLTTTGLTAVTQPRDSLAALQRRIDAYDDWRLTALQSATAAMGSLIIGLALPKAAWTSTPPSRPRSWTKPTRSSNGARIGKPPTAAPNSRATSTRPPSSWGCSRLPEGAPEAGGTAMAVDLDGNLAEPGFRRQPAQIGAAVGIFARIAHADIPAVIQRIDREQEGAVRLQQPGRLLEKRPQIGEIAKNA